MRSSVCTYKMYYLAGADLEGGHRGNPPLSLGPEGGRPCAEGAERQLRRSALSVQGWQPLRRVSRPPAPPPPPVLDPRLLYLIFILVTQDLINFMTSILPISLWGNMKMLHVKYKPTETTQFFQEHDHSSHL